MALVHVVDLLDIASRQRPAVAHEALLLWWHGVVAAAARVVHDAPKVVRRPAAVGVVGAVVRRTRVGAVGLEILRPPTGGDVLPVHGQEGTVAVVVGGRVGALLLVVHPDRVADLVDHAAEVAHGVAPAEVDPRCAIAHARQVAAARAVDAHHDVGAAGLRRLFDEVDARLVTPLLHSYAEGLLPAVIDIAFESIVDRDKLLPLVLHARRRRELAVPPGPAAGATISRPARPLEARRLGIRHVSRILIQVNTIDHVLVIQAVLLGGLADLLAGDDRVDVLQVTLLDVPVRAGHAVVLEVTLVAEDLQGAALAHLILRCGPERSGIKGETSPRRPSVPDLLVQHGGAAAADGAALDAEDVHALAQAELVAELRRRLVRGVEGDTAHAELRRVPLHARHIQQGVIALVPVGLGEREAADRLVPASIQPSAVILLGAALRRARGTDLRPAACARRHIGRPRAGARRRVVERRPVVNRKAAHISEVLGAAVLEAAAKGAGSPSKRAGTGTVFIFRNLHVLQTAPRCARLQETVSTRGIRQGLNGAFLSGNG
mmetsp:Transcript_106732/g.334804  ORF Transcript_106732/g.334804 Transcript_106732/m.334804 type:complete len:547 (-) Transcript_106732:140-1780(-)